MHFGFPRKNERLVSGQLERLIQWNEAPDLAPYENCGWNLSRGRSWILNLSEDRRKRHSVGNIHTEVRQVLAK